MKDFWFFFPLKYLLRALGGIPVPRKKSGSNLTGQLIELFNDTDYVNLAVTPEGTRKKNSDWKTGFIYIAKGAGVPIELALIDYSLKKVIIKKELDPAKDNVEKTLSEIKKYYSQFTHAARYPENFKV